MSKELTPEEIWELNERQKRERVENNSKTISQSNTTRQKLAQHADTLMPGSGESVKNKQSWLDIDKKKNTGEPLTPMENFMEGLSYFTPELIAGTIGGWRYGPDEAAKIMKPIRDKNEQANEPLSPYQKASLAMQKKRLLQKEKEAAGLRQRFGIRGLQRLEDAEAKEEIRQTAFRKGVHHLAVMEDLLRKHPEDLTGMWDAKVARAKEIAGIPTPTTKFKSAATKYVAEYIREISGAQASDREVDRLQKAMPGENEQEEVNLERILALRKITELIEARNRRIKARFGGRLPRGKTVKDYITEENTIPVDTILNETRYGKLQRLRKKLKRKRN